MPMKMPEKRLPPFALIFILSVPCFAQTLLFKTGFESSTTLDPVPNQNYTASASVYLQFHNTDNSTGFTWPMQPFPLSGHSGIRVDSASTSGNYSTSFKDYIDTTPTDCHSGSQCLYQEITTYNIGHCCPQQPIGETQLSSPVTEFYERFWMRYPSSFQNLVNDFNSYNEDSIIYWKTLDDYRIEPDISTSPSHNNVLHGHMKADPGGITAGCTYYNPITFAVISDGCSNYTYANEDNLEYAIIPGNWLQVEFYFKRSHNPDGRIALAINGHVIVDTNVVTYGPGNEEIRDFGFTQQYGYIQPNIKYIDDWEIWDTIPCTNFPCQSVTGTGGGPVATPPPATRFPQTSYNGVVGTVGVPFSYQLSAVGATSYSTGGCPLPPGLSLNTSTGVISGTPTTAGAWNNCQFQMLNNSGKDAQYMYFQIDSTLQKPIIAYFWSKGSSLNWITMGTNVTLSIDNGVGTVSGPNGSITVNPTSATTYRLTASNGAGSTSTTALGNAASATVTVGSGNALSPPSGLTATVQ